MNKLNETRKVHNLQLSTEFFSDVYAGKKTFLCRMNDCNFEEEDELIFCEYDKQRQEFTGRIFCVVITYILLGGQYGILPGYIVMSVRKITGAEINIDKVIGFSKDIEDDYIVYCGKCHAQKREIE